MRKKSTNIDDKNLLIIGMNASRSNIHKNIFLKKKHNGRKLTSKLTIIILVLLLVSLASIIGINKYVQYTSLPLVVVNNNNLPEYDAIIVLDTEADPDVSLESFLSSSMDVYFSDYSNKLLLTSDHSNSNEITAMKDFLIKKDIKPENIFLDYMSSSTYVSIYRAKEVYEINSALIISSELSLPRALYIAKSIGIDCNGVINSSESKGTEFTFKEKLSEYLLTFKDFIKVKFSSPDESIFHDTYKK